MNWDDLQRQLAREARDYLADLREIIESLRYVEGWIALGLVFAVIAMTVFWFITSLGFNPTNEHISRLLVTFGQYPCAPVSNVAGAVIFIDLGMLILLAAMTLGSMFGLLNRIRQGLPREPRELIVLSSLMLVVGIGGIIFMRSVC